jgi:hypothetical protein
LFPLLRKALKLILQLESYYTTIIKSCMTSRFLQQLTICTQQVESEHHYWNCHISLNAVKR